MNKFFEIFNCEKIRRLVRDNKDIIKTAALPLVLGLAVLFFWVYGSADEQETEVLSGTSGLSDEQPAADNGYSGKIFVDISGAVNSPGVYQAEEGSRLFRIIEMAGGLKDGYDPDGINQAEEVFDGQKIIIPYGTADSMTDDATKSSSDGITNGKVNLNLAESAVLQTIPGIGPSKADRIIEYRNSHGRFRSIEDIMNITGIGEKTFESIKAYITV